MSSVPQKVTNTVVQHFEWDVPFILRLQEVPDDGAHDLLAAKLETELERISGRSLVADFVAIAKRYVDWVEVLTRLREGQVEGR